MRPLGPALATLATLATLAALGQGCLTGRHLYYVDEAPAVDELQATSSVDENDAATSDSSAVGNASDDGDDGGVLAPPPAKPPPGPPPTPATPPIAGETCTDIATACVKGGAMQTCITTSAKGVCSKLAYTHQGKSFACTTGCTSDECLPPYYAAYTSCQDAAGACSQLAVCCEAAGLFRRLACRTAHSNYVKEAYGDIPCKAALTNYRTQGVCP